MFYDTCLMHLLQLVKLLESKEANHIEFCKIKNVLDEVIQMHGNSELHEILKLLIDPTWAATGLNIDFEKLVRIIGVLPLFAGYMEYLKEIMILNQ